MELWLGGANFGETGAGGARQAAFEPFRAWAALALTLSRVFQVFDTELKL